MPGILYEKVSKKRMIVVGVSKDWDTFTPWELDGNIMPYFGIRNKISKSGNMKFTYIFIGPFSVVHAKWIG